MTDQWPSESRNKAAALLPAELERLRRELGSYIELQYADKHSQLMHRIGRCISFAEIAENLAVQNILDVVIHLLNQLANTTSDTDHLDTISRLTNVRDELREYML